MAKSKVLKNPIGLVKTQKDAFDFVEAMKSVHEKLVDHAGVHCPPEVDKEIKLESAEKFFQMAMFVGMLALLDEGVK